MRLVGADATSGRGLWWSNRADGLDSTLTRRFDLTGASSATLRFNLWYDTERDFDYLYVLASADGGTTWQLIKFISDKAGFIDIAMDPRNPNVLFAASYERVRKPYYLKSGGPGSALSPSGQSRAARRKASSAAGRFPCTRRALPVKAQA